MWPCRSFTDCHHTFKASAQKSLVSRDRVKINVSAPVASINTPNGVHFVSAGGAWSHAPGVFPSESVRLFPPTRVVPLVDFRLGVDGVSRDPNRYEVSEPELLRGLRLS